MKQMDDNIGNVLQELEEMGQSDNTIVVFTTDNGAEAISFPDGGVTPFKGQKGEAKAANLMGWVGWAFKPTNVVDLRRPKEAQRETDAREGRALR